MLRFVTVFAAAVAVTLAGPNPHPYNVFKIDITPEEAQQYLSNLPFNQPQLSARTNVLPLVRYDNPQFRVADSGPTLGHYWKNGQEIQNVDDYVDEVYDASQFHGQDGLGAYAYGYRAPESSKVENRARSGDVTGSYTYKDGNNNDIMVRYWADSEGFHQEDNLPKVELKPVEDTEEVKQARLAHQKAWQEAADAALHPGAQPQQQSQQYTGGNYQYQASGSAPQAAYQPVSQPQQGYQAISQTNNYQEAASEQQQVSVSAPAPVQSQTSQANQPREGKAFSSAQASYQGQQIKTQEYGQPQKYAQQGQYQQNQYQSGQSQQTPVQQGSHSQQSSQYANSPQNEYINDGQYHNEEPEPTGPPRGFFYSFDYPVSIIVRKDAQNQSGPKPVNPGTPIDHDTVGVDSRRYG